MALGVLAAVVVAALAGVAIDMIVVWEMCVVAAMVAVIVVDEGVAAAANASVVDDVAISAAVAEAVALDVAVAGAIRVCGHINLKHVRGVIGNFRQSEENLDAR